MMGRMASRGLTSLALLCASLAWTGYVFLDTVGDPSRAEDVATALLDDDASREQIATTFALQIVRASGIDRSNIDVVEGAVAEALLDPRITSDLISAFGSAHANALGVDDPRSTTIETNELVAVVRDRLGVLTPEMAAQLPDGVLPEVTLPTFHPPGVGTVRTVADAATGALALAAVALLAVAFALGDRRRVLRRAGIWAILAGVFWTIIPIGIVAGARAWASDADAVVEAAVRASVDSVAPVAIGLLIIGGVAVMLSFVPALWPERNEVQRRGSVIRGTQMPGPASYAPRPNPAAHPGAAGVGVASGAVGGVGSLAAPTTTARVDTYIPSGTALPPQAFPQQPHAPQGPQSGAPAHVPMQQPVGGPQRQQPAPPADDVDPWSTYFGPSKE